MFTLGDAITADEENSAINQTPAVSNERARRRIHLLLSVVFWLVIFEGALRKWGPSATSTALYFVRDPFVLAAYAIALRHRIFPKHWLFTGFLALAFFIVLLGLVDILTLGEHPFVVFLGIRSYVLYAPLAFLWPVTMSTMQLNRLWRRILFISLPMAALIFMQYYSSPDSPINAFVGGEISSFTTGGHVRATGTFSFILGQSIFEIFLLSVTLGELCRRRDQQISSRLLRWAATAAVLIAVSFSVSRTAAIGSAIIMSAAIYASAFSGYGGRFSPGRTFGPLLLLTVMISLIFTFLPEGVATLVERHEGAVAEEGSESSRALGSITGGNSPLNLTSFGIGLGVGSPAAFRFNRYDPTINLSEYELPRILQELGVFVGSAYLLFRAVLATYLMTLGFQVMRRFGDPSVFLLAICCTIQLLSGDVESNPSVGGIIWTAVGLALGTAKSRSIESPV